MTLLPEGKDPCSFLSICGWWRISVLIRSVDFLPSRIIPQGWPMCKEQVLTYYAVEIRMQCDTGQRDEKINQKKMPFISISHSMNMEKRKKKKKNNKHTTFSFQHFKGALNLRLFLLFWTPDKKWMALTHSPPLSCIVLVPLLTNFN